MMHKARAKRHLLACLLGGSLLCALGPGCARARSSGPGASSAPPPAGLPPLAPGEAPAPTGEPGSQFHGPAGAPMGSADELPPGHPTVGGTGENGAALPPGHPTMGGGEGGTDGKPAPVDPNQVVEGVIRLDPKVRDHVKAGDTLFLSLRESQNEQPGQILAVDRMVAKEFPMRFSIGSSKAMVPGTRLRGTVVVTARIDKDGDAMTHEPGDVVGTLTVKVPEKHAVLTLDTVLK